MKAVFTVIVGACMAWPATPVCEQWIDASTREKLTQAQALGRSEIECQKQAINQHVP